MVAKVIWAGGERDGSAIAERAARGVNALAALGVGEGDVVAILLRNEVAFLEAMLIARQAGCYSCPINWHYKADEAGYILHDCNAKALIVHADLLRQIEGGVPPGCVVIVVEPPPELREPEPRMLQASHINPLTGEEEVTQAAYDPSAPRPRDLAVDPNNPQTWGKVQRNAACPCGSGRKFKHCHGALV